MGHWLDALAKASIGHRARHRTLDSGTGAALEPGRPDAITPAREAQGLTRRALLRRGAVVGAAVWSTPVLQSAIAPAAAASGDPGCTVACPPGSLCGAGITCATGLICLNGTCVIPYGGTTPCTASSQCQSGNCFGGICIASWPGTPCNSHSQCLSNKCAGGTCFDNPLGGLCQTTADCADNTQCPASGSPKVCGGIGAPCANKNKCTSGRCQGGYCVP